MLEVIDKYKFGIMGAFVCYLFIFAYTNLITYDHYTDIIPFTEKANIEKESKEDILEITPEKIEVPNDFDMNVKSLAQNVDDDRKASATDYAPNISPAQIQQQIKALEAQMKDEAGGSKERARLAGLIEERKKTQEDIKKNSSQPTPTNGSASSNKYSGSVMVSWDLNNRKAFNNDDTYVGIPGYRCPESSGVVVVNVKTDSNGNVIKAEYNAGASKNASSCMISNALNYAKSSRFEVTSDVSKHSGRIVYTYIYRP